jgi:hypothetical protein
VLVASVALAFMRPPAALPSAAVTLYAPASTSVAEAIAAADQRRASMDLIRAGQLSANTIATAPATPAHTSEVAASVPF